MIHLFLKYFFKCISLYVCPVFNLTNNVDVESTKQIMEQYQRDNRDVIQKNKAKLVSAHGSDFTSKNLF